MAKVGVFGLKQVGSFKNFLFFAFFEIPEMMRVDVSAFVGAFPCLCLPDVWRESGRGNRKERKKYSDVKQLAAGGPRGSA